MARRRAMSIGQGYHSIRTPLVGLKRHHPVRRGWHFYIHIYIYISSISYIICFLFLNANWCKRKGAKELQVSIIPSHGVENDPNSVPQRQFGWSLMESPQVELYYGFSSTFYPQKIHMETETCP